ncbi:hypothetical protein V490_00608 [Pseudogymnoascus sp. VKM F-3557]|nr:hypothetical protein V490_00608 [Pseudogymnoascus sp. VKM F-3557]
MSLPFKVDFCYDYICISPTVCIICHLPTTTAIYKEEVLALSTNNMPPIDRQQTLVPTDNPLQHLELPVYRTISHKELLCLIKQTYASLLEDENKCIEEHAQLRRDAPSRTQLYPDLIHRSKALMNLSKALINKHWNFLIACNSPYATDKMRCLPSREMMPARLWRHAIHSLLEILRNWHPTAQVDFIDMVHPLMKDLLENVPEFKNNWTECLGDIFRYRMAAATSPEDWDDDAGTARQWYLKTAAQIPETGRLYHHLAIVAQSDELQQLFYYLKSLIVAKPFTRTHESIKTLLNPKPDLAGGCCSSIAVQAILRSHALIFEEASLDTSSQQLSEIKSSLDAYIANTSKKYLVQGYYIAICNIIALLGYGAHDNLLNPLLERQPPNQGTIIPEADSTLRTAALCLFIQTTEVHLLRIGDMNILSFLHVTLVFIRHLSHYPSAASLIFPHFPWNSLVNALNAIIVPPATREVIESPAFPGFEPLSHLETPQRTPRAQQHIEGESKAIGPYKYTTYPFPEDRAMQGLPFAETYFPKGWFTDKNAEPDTHYAEAETTSSHHRPVRVLWLAVAISQLAEEWIGYGGARFFVGENAKSGAVTIARRNGHTHKQLDRSILRPVLRSNEGGARMGKSSAQVPYNQTTTNYIATEEKKGFGSIYKGLPLQKLQSLKKWSSWAKAEPPRQLQRKAVKFLKDVECCVSGELRFLLEISGKLSEALFSQFHDGYIPPLQKYWDISSHPKGLIEAYTLFKEGKIGGDSYEQQGESSPSHAMQEIELPPALAPLHHTHQRRQHDPHDCVLLQRLPSSNNINLRPNSNNSLPSFLENSYWKTKLPESFESIEWLHNMSDETKKLWDNDPPKLVPSQFNNDLPTIATQVLQFIATATFDEFNIHQHGERTSGETKEEIRGLAFNCYNQALTSTMFPMQPPQRPVTMIDVNIPLTPEPPESLSSRWNICNTVSSSLVTPTWAYTDFHYDTLYRGFAEPVGDCVKFWILSPAKPNWNLFIDSTGIDNRLAKIGDKLKGTVMVLTDSSNGLEFGSGTLHAVFTISGGILLSSNYSTSESLTTMSELILGQLNPDYFENCKTIAHEDLEVYKATLSETLQIVRLRENALKSWITLQEPLQKLVQQMAASSPFKKTAMSIDKVIKDFAVKMAGLSGKCECGSQDDLEKKSAADVIVVLWKGLGTVFLPPPRRQSHRTLPPRYRPSIPSFS